MKERVVLSIPFLANSNYFCHLLINFANSLDPDQDRQNASPDLDRPDMDQTVCLCGSVPERIFLKS